MLTDAQRTILEGLARPGSYLDHYSPTAALAIRTVLEDHARLEAQVQRLLERMEQMLREQATPCS